MYVLAVRFKSVLILFHLSYVSSYQLVLRLNDNVRDPQTQCFRTMKGKIAKEDDIMKNKKLIAGCVPPHIPFWIGPMSTANSSEYLAGKMCIFINTTLSRHFLNCVDDEKYFPKSAYICKTEKLYEKSGGKNCMRQKDNIASTMQLSTENINVTPYRFNESMKQKEYTVSTMPLSTVHDSAIPYRVTESKLSASNENSTTTRYAASLFKTTENISKLYNTHVVQGKEISKGNNLEIKKKKVNKGSKGFLDKHKVQVGIVLGTLLFTVVVIASIVLLFKLKRRHTKLRRDSSASDRNRLQLESQYLKKTSRGDIRSLASCTLSNDIEIFAIDDDEHPNDNDFGYMYNHLQRSVSDPVVNAI